MGLRKNKANRSPSAQELARPDDMQDEWGAKVEEAYITSPPTIFKPTHISRANLPILMTLVKKISRKYFNHNKCQTLKSKQ